MRMLQFNYNEFSIVVGINQYMIGVVDLVVGKNLWTLISLGRFGDSGSFIMKRMSFKSMM